MDLIDRMSSHLKASLKHAIVLATRQGYSIVYPEHLLLGLLSQRGSVATELLRKYQCNKRALTQYALRHRKHKNLKPIPELSKESIQSVERSVMIGAQYGHNAIGTEHVLLAMIESNTKSIQRAIAATKIEQPQELAAYLRVILKSTSKFQEMRGALEQQQDGSSSSESSHTPAELSALTHTQPHSKVQLHNFVRNLTDPEVQKAIDPVIGREAEIARLIHILCRKTKNNPLLLGDPGVGKTAIVEGLAKRIVHGDVPHPLRNKKILALDMGLLIAGTMYRGEFESRLKAIIDQIKRDPNTIVFIDEVHMIVGAGATSGSLDAANLLKPALARGELRCIGATTYPEYKKHIEHDSALDRRFAKIMVEEPTMEKTRAILDGLKPTYEQYHNVTISDDALRAAIESAKRYLPEYHFPDKAIDLLDEAAAAFRASAPQHPLDAKIIQTEEALRAIVSEKHQAVLAEDFERALRAKEHQQALERTREQLINRREKRGQSKHQITATNIAHVIARRIGAPVSSITFTGEHRLTAVTDHINSRIVGQSRAKTHIHNTLTKGLLDLHTRKRPMASLLFAGPSGTGKTHSAHVIAQALYGEQNNCVVINMADFKEPHAVAKLIGSPAGYVGYKDATTIADTIKRQPFSVLLFDEVDKAHTDMRNILLQMLDTGVLTDASGRAIDVTNNTVIMTTTAGSTHLAGGNIGFGSPDTKNTNARLRRTLEERFGKEFCNRVDTLVLFDSLSQTDLEHIAKRELTQYLKKITKRGVDLRIDDSIAKWIARTAKDSPQMGRTVYTIIETKILPVITSHVIAGNASAPHILRRVGNQIKLSA